MQGPVHRTARLAALMALAASVSRPVDSSAQTPPTDDLQSAHTRPATTAKPATRLDSPDDAERRDDAGSFRRRLASLQQKFTTFDVRMAPGDDPEAVKRPPAPEGPVPISGQRLGIYTPAVLSPEDVMLVVRQHMPDIRRCYKKQLRSDPTWADQVILDLAIKRSGRVSEVGVAPRRVRRALIGRCIMRTVPRWRFPRFTGELDDGITQEVLNASFPFNFNPR